MKCLKRSVTFVLALTIVLSMGVASFAGTNYDRINYYGYAYYLDQEADGTESWRIKIPNEPYLEFTVNPGDIDNKKNISNFREAVKGIKVNYDAFKRIAKPSKSMKKSNPQQYKIEYDRYQIIRRVVLELIKEKDVVVLSDGEKVRDAFYKYADKHYLGFGYDFYSQDVTHAIKMASAANDAIVYYNSVK